jgi:uncharacterized membrane protein
MYIGYYTLYTYYKCTWFIKSSSTDIHTKPKPNQNKLITEQEFLLSFLLPLPLNSTSVYAITKVQLTIKGTHQLLGYIENVNLLDKNINNSMVAAMKANAQKT